MPQLTLLEAFKQAVEHYQGGRLELARNLLGEILSHAPDYPQAMHLMGILMIEGGDLSGGEALIARAISIRPNDAEILLALGGMLSKLGKVDLAIAYHRRGLAISPALGWAHNNLGALLLNKGLVDEALEHFQRAVEATPGLHQAFNNLGAILQQMGRFGEAIGAFEKALALCPDSPGIHTNLGNALLRDGRLDEAIACYEKSARIEPTYALSHYNLGTALKESGLLKEALGAFKKAMELSPGDAKARSNLIYTMHFDPEMDLGALLQEHRIWNQVHGAPFRPMRRTSWLCDRNPGRALRVGFVSPDLKLHPVGRFLMPLLRGLDRSKIQAICYSDNLMPDDITREMRTLAGEWRDCAGMNDLALANQIVEDRVDILVDLTMHMANNRMTLFAMKPAPVQATWLAYCSTTGLETMDYRISDPHMDPAGLWESFYTEKTVRLPRTYWCYEAPREAPEPGTLPALTNGFFTFGCLNNISKINDAVIGAWSQAMKRVEGSRLLLHARAGKARRVLLEKFGALGINASRIEFAEMVPFGEYLRLHQRIDLALDPFPYNGGTTSCDALWMGVGVLTVLGDRPMGRAGASLLRNLGLESWIAGDLAGYVELAVQAAGRLEELAALRKTLRQRMRESPLMDIAGFANDFETLLRSLWIDFIGKTP